MSIRNRVHLACALLLIAYAIGSVRYAGVWQNELTLWTAAVAHAPNKPRPHIQLALALMERRQFSNAQIVLDDLDWILSESAHPMPIWDRADAKIAEQQNRALLARLAGAGPKL